VLIKVEEVVKELVEDVNRIKTLLLLLLLKGVGNVNKYNKNLIKVIKRVRNQIIKKINHKRKMLMNSKLVR